MDWENIHWEQNPIKKNGKHRNQSEIAVYRQKITNRKRKLGSNNKLGMDLENHLEENPIQKQKKVKIKVKLPDVNKKTTSEKANFCSTNVFSLYSKISKTKVYKNCFKLSDQ